MKRSRAAIGTALVTSTLTSIALLAGAPAATAAEVSEPLVEELQGALQFEVTNKSLLVGQNMPTDPEDPEAPSMGALSSVNDDGSITNLYEKTGVGIEVSGMASRKGSVAFLLSRMDHKNPGAWLMLRDKDGKVTKVANLQKFEEESNPDRKTQYNVRGLSDKCVAKLPDEVRPYKGIVESHPYAIANAPGGGWYVADAAGNSVLKVTKNGGVKTVHVMKAATVKITEAMAEEFGLPGCVVAQKGKAAFEGVPTDVEVMENGKLVVSSLPGGPEIEGLAPMGSVWRVDPETGKGKKLAGGLVSATNVAVSDTGDIYVTELFRGRISQLIGDGETETVVDEVDSPAAIEWHDGQLYASIGLMSPNGRIVSISPGTISD
jgi:hypothetical protein